MASPNPKNFCSALFPLWDLYSKIEADNWHTTIKKRGWFVIEDHIFKAGVVPGGPTSHDEIKILVCYMLSQTGIEMSFSEIHDALSVHHLVNYFELVQAIDGLLKTTHLTLHEKGKTEYYGLSDLGKQVEREFSHLLPLSIREKSVKAAKRILRRKKREQEVNVEIERVQDGYRMQLSIPEQDGQLVSFSLFLPTLAECERVRKRFLNDPVFIYKAVLALLTGDQEVIGKIFPTEEPLF